MTMTQKAISASSSTGVSSSKFPPRLWTSTPSAPKRQTTRSNRSATTARSGKCLQSPPPLFSTQHSAAGTVVLTRRTVTCQDTCSSITSGSGRKKTARMSAATHPTTPRANILTQTPSCTATQRCPAATTPAHRSTHLPRHVPSSPTAAVAGSRSYPGKRARLGGSASRSSASGSSASQSSSRRRLARCGGGPGRRRTARRTRGRRALRC
mmetsp:Transcript_43911/g.108643  ORF Transcript_43911/g.108643 Transcript_43911/m.108643 type:complete len:210 (-) Transcript_43911:328-957(-)